MSIDRRRNRILTIGVVLMLLALFTYLATLDDSDPDVLPESADRIEGGMP